MLAPILPRPTIPNCIESLLFQLVFSSMCRLLLLAVAADKVGGGCIMLQGRLRWGFDLGNDVLSQYLAKFHAPLIEGVDMPDGPLSEDRVLIERDQLAQCLRGEFIGHDDVRWAVAFKHAVRPQPVGGSLGFDLLGCL